VHSGLSQEIWLDKPAWHAAEVQVAADMVVILATRR
jgi:hypothetical protein